ncbi:hypothetical protein BR93DRAFT_938341 [Coniochaeta sp. PMI_546]|nr:hypothetical protein BR93DRAFT_938341 [Coniochaeta sp. PMI_546]
MDWLIKTHDVMSPNVNSLYFGSGTSRVIKTVFDDESAAIDKETESEDQLNEWLEARTTFDNIVHRMQINGSAVSTIFKGGTAVFNKTTISRRRDGLPAIKLERQRQFSLVEAGLTQRAQFLMNLLRNNTYDWKFRSDDEEDTSTIDAVDLWMDISNLCNALKRWREQLLLMISHADELPGVQLHGDPPDRTADGSSTPRSHPDPDMAFQRDIRIAGTLIKERLIEISMEYEEKIRDCDMMMDGMAMATQLAHAKTNMEIAVQTRGDGSQMKSIAILTMVFLPATFVAVSHMSIQLRVDYEY